MRDQSAFSLLEITVVLTVLAVLSTMGIKVYQEQDYSKKTEETRTRLDRLEGALANYRNTHHRLPCPANPALKPDDTGYGYEGQNSGNCTDGSPATSFTAGETVAGMIPVRTMQLPDEVAYDAWGRRFTYAVDRRMTHIQAAFKYGAKNCDIGAITVNDASGNARTTKAIYALVSHGENGHGAYLSSGQVRNAKSTNASELVNANLSSNTYVMRRETRASASLFNRFDDLLRYKERWAMVNAVDVTIQHTSAAPHFTAISTSWETTCALHSSGQIYCWGENGNGEIGDGTTTNRLNFTQVILPTGVTHWLALADMGHTGRHNCAIANTGAAYCWGLNNHGQLGDGTNTLRKKPTNPVVFPPGVTAFNKLFGGSLHTCAIANDNNAYCWGLNNQGQLGDGTTISRNVPTAISAAAGIAYYITLSMDETATGTNTRTCGLANTKRAYCWGAGGFLGNGTTVQSLVPVPVTHPADIFFSDVSVGSDQACALGYDGNVYCWGNSGTRQPALVAKPAGISAFSHLSAGGDNICALGNDAVPYCFGYGIGIGDGVGASSNTFKKVNLPGITTRYLQSGCQYGCLLSHTNSLYCWGRNTTGHLGDGTTTDRLSPVVINTGDPACHP